MSALEGDIEFHKLADIFPMMSASEYAALKADIAQHGLRQPIVIWQNKIVDGRNRYRACLELPNVAPRFREWDGKGELLAYIVSQNLHRRHLSESQRAAVAAKLANMPLGGAVYRSANLPTDGVSQPEAAEMLNVSERSLRSAKKVIEEGIPQLSQALEQGKVAVSVAAKAVELPEEQQVAFVDMVSQGKKPARALKTIRRLASRQEYAQEGERVGLVSESYQLIVGDFREAPMSPDSIDVIITDLPYGKEYVALYGQLAEFAASVLKEGCSLLVMAGQSYLPDILAAMSLHLQYHWIVSYQTPGGQASQVWPCKVSAFWKPVLWFVKGKYAGDWVGDVVKSDVNDNDKRFSDWGQSESGIARLVEGWSKPGQIVLDPCCGAGTTGVTSVARGRYFIGIDVDDDQIRIAAARIGRLRSENEAARQGNLSGGM